MAVSTRKGQTYRASSPDLTPFDPIRNTVGNRPQTAVVRSSGTNVEKGGTYKAANTQAKRKQEPTLPRRDYTQP